jgi:hypothetical protein
VVQWWGFLNYCGRFFLLALRCGFAMGAALGAGFSELVLFGFRWFEASIASW